MVENIIKNKLNLPPISLGFIKTSSTKGLLIAIPKDGIEHPIRM
ncbi:MAG: hypothetical protein ACTSUP_00590 [Candidatus Heimdallarchaeaceae archaeon]